MKGAFTMAGSNSMFRKPRTRNGTAEDVSFFRKRQVARGVVWTDVEWALLAQVLTLCIQENIGVGFYSASGGRGVCFKLYAGKRLPDTEYANTAEEMNELLDGVLEKMGYKADDGSRVDAADD